VENHKILKTLCRWWIAGLVLHRYDLGWLIPFLLWLSITIRLTTLYISTKHITELITSVWIIAVRNPIGLISERLRLPLAAAGTIAILLVGTFSSPDSEDNTRANRAVSLFGLLVFIFGFYATSKHRKSIKWQTVIVGVLAQFLLALFVLRTKAGVSVEKTEFINPRLMLSFSMTFSISLPSWRNRFLALRQMVRSSSPVPALSSKAGS